MWKFLKLLKNQKTESMYYFRRKYVNWQIRKANVLRTKEYVGLTNAKSVCVLFCAKDVTQETFTKIKNQLEHHFESIKFIAYQNDKNVIEYDGDVLNFSKKQTCFCKPEKRITDEFLTNHSDLLIDLTLKEKLPLKYLVAVSASKCKCGLSKECYDIYDVEIRKEETPSVGDLLSYILKYLEMIKTK